MSGDGYLVHEQAYAETEQTGVCTKCSARRQDGWVGCPMDGICPAPDYPYRVSITGADTVIATASGPTRSIAQILREEPKKASGDFSIGGELWPGLSKLLEETGETNEQLAEFILMRTLGRLAQAGGKLIGSHGEVNHWDGSNLKERLEDELADLAAAAAFFIRVNRLDIARMLARTNAKQRLFSQWAEEGK